MDRTEQLLKRLKFEQRIPTIVRGGKVYLIKAGEFVKIGHTYHCVLTRIAGLKTGCPYPMTALAEMYGEREVEQALHKEFKEYHQHNEWYRLPDDVLTSLVERFRQAMENE